LRSVGCYLLSLSRRPHKSIHIAFICRDFTTRDSLKDNLQSYYSYSSVFYDVQIISRILQFVNSFFKFSPEKVFRPKFSADVYNRLPM
jgi:hypothetical protein